LQKQSSHNTPKVQLKHIFGLENQKVVGGLNSMRESRNLTQSNFNSNNNNNPNHTASMTPDKIKLNEFGRQLFNINAKNYIQEKFPLAVVSQQKKMSQ